MYLVTARNAATFPLSTAAEAVKKATELVNAGDSDVTILAADGNIYEPDEFSELLVGGTDGDKANA